MERIILHHLFVITIDLVYFGYCNFNWFKHQLIVSLYCRGMVECVARCENEYVRLLYLFCADMKLLFSFNKVLVLWDII